MKMAAAAPVKGGAGSDDPNIIGWTEQGLPKYKERFPKK